jgi:tetratricopeptide (TPR) repeat protein
MKRAFLFIAFIAAVGIAGAQTNSTPPPSGNAATVPNSPMPAQPAHSKGAPQAKTQDEYKAYQEIVAKTDIAQMEAAADEFAQKYPTSDLRVVLYNALMNTYRNGGATDRAIAAGRKSLAIDSTDPVPNVMVALALAQTTRDSDLDRDDRLKEAATDAQRAIDNIDTGMAIPPSTPPEKVQAAKNSILEMAYETEGTIGMTRKDYAAAETAFRKGLNVNKTDPDGVLYLRLAIALDNEKKYPEALEAADAAIKYNQPGSEAQNLANQEKTRLQKLVGSATPSAAPAPTAQ